MRIFAQAPLLAVSLLLPLSSPALGQSLLVHVIEAESGDPIPGAFVSLLDQDGRVLRSALTGPSGRFLFQIPSPGIFQVRAEMIGRATRVSSPLTLRAEESGQTSLHLPFHAISLAGIDVEADERCRLRPDEASQIARVWDEVGRRLGS